jgi:hypothetical protein
MIQLMMMMMLMMMLMCACACTEARLEAEVKLFFWLHRGVPMELVIAGHLLFFPKTLFQLLRP